MESDTYEQFAMTAEDIGDQSVFLQDGMEGIQAIVVDGKLVSVELPDTVVLEVVEADPVMKGATAKAQFKRAVVGDGIEIKVPGYVAVGTRIKVDTRDRHFIERVRD